MRIEFPHAAREDFHWTRAQLRVGSAPDNDLVLTAGQAAEHHLRIQQDRRGLILQVLPSADRIHVNARPVRERALLRAGDIISVGDCRMLVRDDEDLSGRELPLAVAPRDRCIVALRAVAGPLSGRVWPVRGSLELGSPGDCPLQPALGDQIGIQLRWVDGRIVLLGGKGTEAQPLRINGVELAEDTVLCPGDQIGVGSHRFVLDAPGMQFKPTPVEGASASNDSTDDPGAPSREVGWLILTAAALAVGIALVLLIRF